MSPALVRGLVTVALGAAWFTFGAPRAVAWLETVRDTPRGQRGAAELTADGGLDRLPPKARALVVEALALSRREDAWGYVVASLLSPAERTDGLARAGAAPAVLAIPGLSLEPEMPALVDALLARYGPATLPAPDVPHREDWPMVDRRTRARVLLALVQGPGLDDERAAIVLGVTLDLLAAQARRTEIEAELAAY